MAASDKGDFLLGLLIGAAAGAAAALLYAPAPGSETREQVKSATGNAVGRAGEVAATVRDRAADVTSKAGDIASTVKERAADVTSKVKTQAQDLASRGKDVAKEASQRGSELASSASEMKDRAVETAQSAVAQVSGASEKGGSDWPSQLPEAAAEENRRKMDQHTLQVSDDPKVATERVNAAMQGSGEEARKIAEELAKAPSGDDSKV